MHKGVILLVKTDSKDDVASEVSNFMEKHGEGRVWDWYVIGGRWSGTLMESTEEFNKKVNAFLVKTKQTKKGDFGISYSVIEDKENQRKFQDIWEEFGNKTLNPMSRDSFVAYSGKQLEGKYEEVEQEDIRPLSKCIEIVKSWVVDTEKEKKETWDKMISEHGKSSTMDAYYAGVYRSYAYREFSFETGVYNITEFCGEEIPLDIKNYYAVMVDMHN